MLFHIGIFRLELWNRSWSWFYYPFRHLPCLLEETVKNPVGMAGEEAYMPSTPPECIIHYKLDVTYAHIKIMGHALQFEIYYNRRGLKISFIDTFTTNR
jgi:hypothetical protein